MTETDKTRDQKLVSALSDSLLAAIIAFALFSLVLGLRTVDGATGLTLLFESFAYKRGVPAEADFVFDARVLPNPHWDPDLRALSGREPGVRDYLEAQPDVQRYLAQLMDFLDTWLPKLGDGTRSYVTVAFGCTGGKHRSVFLAERMARHAREMGWQDVATYHREQD